MYALSKYNMDTNEQILLENGTDRLALHRVAAKLNKTRYAFACLSISLFNNNKKSFFLSSTCFPILSDYWHMLWNQLRAQYSCLFMSILGLGCHNQISQTAWLEQQKISHSSGDKKSKGKCQKVLVLGGFSHCLANGQLFAVSPHATLLIVCLNDLI